MSPISGVRRPASGVPGLLLTVALRELEVGHAYAVWIGIGTAGRCDG